MKIEGHIQELLFQYDCVVIPGFGGFVCSFKPASIHPVKHRFEPPAKKISFNRMLISNDGLLAHHISTASNIPYATAMDQLASVVKEWESRLNSGRSLELEGVGTLFKDGSGNIQFRENTERNYLLESYGLAAFQAMPINRVSQKIDDKPEEKNVPVRTLPAINRMAKYSVAAAMLSVAVLSAYKLSLFEGIHLDRTSLNPFKTEKAVYDAKEYQRIGLEDEITSDTDLERSEEEVVNINLEVDGEVRELKVRLREPIKKEKVTIGKYHVVAGCFSVKSNARNFMEKLQNQGYQADTSVQHRGLNVVSYQSFANEREARKFLRKVKKEHSSQAWLLVK